jgi:hypothetical protein
MEGVRDIARTGARITVNGDRRIIAHVGAALVRHGPVPEDLGVHVPDLDDAMLSLLENEPATTGTTAEPDDLVGGRR